LKDSIGRLKLEISNHIENKNEVFSSSEDNENLKSHEEFLNHLQMCIKDVVIPFDLKNVYNNNNNNNNNNNTNNNIGDDNLNNTSSQDYFINFHKLFSLLPPTQRDLYFIWKKQIGEDNLNVSSEKKVEIVISFIYNCNFNHW
jgi:hypothetical protein